MKSKRWQLKILIRPDIEYCTQTWTSGFSTWKLECNIEIEGHTKKSDKYNKNSKRLQLDGDIRKIGINYFNRSIVLMSKVFFNGPGDRGSIPKTPKMVLMLPCLTLNTIR